jgi:hypothetical protein
VAYRTTKCLGYGDREGKCDQEAGTPWTPYWCPACDKVRREAITASLEAMAPEVPGHGVGKVKIWSK